MKELTWRQQYILDFITDRIQGGLPPTYREIMDEFDFKSTQAVRDYLTVLKKKGHITTDPKISRGIRLVPQT